MKLKFGVISSDSHGQVRKDTFTSRMSKAKFKGSPNINDPGYDVVWRTCEELFEEIAEADKRKVLWTNAAELYGLA